MTRGIECFKNPSAQVESLAVFDVVDSTLVVAKHALVGCVHPKLVEASCCSGMVSMTVGEKKAYRLLRDALHYLVKIRNVRSGIYQDCLVLSFDNVKGLRSHSISRAYPCVLVNLSEYDVLVAIYLREVDVCLVWICLRECADVCKYRDKCI